MSRPMWATSFGVVCSLWAAEASALEGLSFVAILVDGPNGRATRESVRKDVESAVASRMALRLLSPEELFVANQDAFTGRIADCGSDVPCLASRMRALGARWGLLVVVNLIAEPPLVALRLLDADQRRQVGQFSGPVRSREGTVSRAVRARAERLLDMAGFIPSGRLDVTVDPSDARVRVTGPSAPLERLTGTAYVLVPGSYVVSAAREGFREAAEGVVVRSGTQNAVRLTLEDDQSLWSSPWFWTGVGAVVAAAATVAIVAAAQPDDPCLCLSLPDEPCVCR